MSQRFTGKVAIVTGAGCIGPGWGNGRATATLLARQGAAVASERGAQAGVEVSIKHGRNPW